MEYLLALKLDDGINFLHRFQLKTQGPVVSTYARIFLILPSSPRLFRPFFTFFPNLFFPLGVFYTL